MLSLPHGLRWAVGQGGAGGRLVEHRGRSVRPDGQRVDRRHQRLLRHHRRARDGRLDDEGTFTFDVWDHDAMRDVLTAIMKASHFPSGDQASPPGDSVKLLIGALMPLAVQYMKSWAEPSAAREM